MPAASMKDWLTSKGFLPGWVLSGLFHAGLVWLLVWLMPLWNRPPVGVPTEETREIGIFVKERGEQIEPNDVETSPTDSTPATSVASDPLTPQRVVPDSPNISAPLPQPEQAPTIGPGALLPGEGLPDPNELIKPSRGGGASGSASGGLPGASFLGVEDRGSRVVYVVDASGSMYQHNAMRTAKAALVSSLQGLEPSQQFQIIFYNEQQRVMSLKSAPKRQLYFATDLNKTAARQFIQSIEPDLGTMHFDAIKLALSFNPEVMFVLTDSGDPKLQPRELDDIQRRNAGKTHIHCIEFGIGPELAGDNGNFLKKLAARNGGTYRYVDVTQFSRKRP
jgi:Ca-activated chloride channel family protein